MAKWIKIPGPGEMRGEGKWQTIEEAGCAVEDWEWNRETQYLPTHEGEEHPLSGMAVRCVGGREDCDGGPCRGDVPCNPFAPLDNKGWLDGTA